MRYENLNSTLQFNENFLPPSLIILIIKKKCSHLQICNMPIVKRLFWYFFLQNFLICYFDSLVSLCLISILCIVLLFLWKLEKRVTQKCSVIPCIFASFYSAFCGTFVFQQNRIILMSTYLNKNFICFRTFKKWALRVIKSEKI